MIISIKRLHLLAVPTRVIDMETVSTARNLFGSNQRLAVGVAHLSCQSSYCRSFHQTVLPISSMKTTVGRSAIVSSAIPFSSSNPCNKYKDITDEKKLKAAKIKKLHRDNKELFGELLESSTKAKRLRKASAKKKVAVTEKYINVGESEKSNSVPPPSPKSTSKAKRDSSSSLKVGKSSKRNPKDEVTSRKQPTVTGLGNDINFNQPFQNNGSVDEGKDQLNESLPSVNQLMASFQEQNFCSTVDTTIKTSPKKGRMKPINRGTEIMSKSNSKIAFSAELSNTSKPSRSSSHCTDSSDDRSTKINLTVNEKLLIDEYPTSVNSVATKFPFDNPERMFFEEESSVNPLEIISIPFPRQSDKDTSPSYERDSVPLPRLPSVSKILNATMPKEQAEALEKWQQKMIEKLGEEGFRKYKQGILNNGTELHSKIFSLLNGTPADQLSISKSISGHWSSLQGILSQVERVHILESHVKHPHLNYCGIIDCIAVFRDKLVVIDWKTSQKPKPTVSMTYDTPIQIAAYIGAINYDPNYSIKVTEGLIAIAYENGHNSQVFHLNPFEVSRYWKLWLDRLHLYENQVQLPSSVPFTTSKSEIITS